MLSKVVGTWEKTWEDVWEGKQDMQDKSMKRDSSGISIRALMFESTNYTAPSKIGLYITLIYIMHELTLLAGAISRTLDLWFKQWT